MVGQVFLRNDTLSNLNKVLLLDDIRSIFVGKYNCLSKTLEKKIFFISWLEREFSKNIFKNAFLFKRALMMIKAIFR